MKQINLLLIATVGVATVIAASANAEKNASDESHLERGVYRTVFTMASINGCGEAEQIAAVETRKDETKNPLVRTVSLPTDGNVPDVLPTTPVEVQEPKEVMLKELFEPVVIEPMPAPLLTPDAESIIVLADNIKIDNAVFNPWDPRGIRPLKLTKITFRVGAIMDGVRPVAIINGKLLLKGNAIDGFTLTRIEPTFVIMTHDGKHLQLPVGRQIQVRMTK